MNFRNGSLINKVVFRLCKHSCSICFHSWLLLIEIKWEKCLLCFFCFRSVFLLIV
uniref:Uncharacterized protein n=1 Tax=Arundo donax TaxID=35708 RepID=A0A0A8XVM0_ARUDO